MHFFEPMQKLAEIEPRADLFVQDQLRGGRSFFYSEVLDGLMKDADRLAGVERRLFGRSVGAGLNALNPGLARGVLHTAADAKRPESFRRDGIYLLPETVADLPPVAGILTRGAGNPLCTCSCSPATSASPTWRWTPGSWRRSARTTGRRSSSR